MRQPADSKKGVKMPLTRVSLMQGKSKEYIDAILLNLYEAMREDFDVPEEDRFMTVTQHAEHEFVYSATYLGIHRTKDLVMIQITCNNTRTAEQKKALYHRIAERLSMNPGIRPEDILVNLVEVPKENWSFGCGQAQYA
jgi:4-oxalocrotonate tautomerase